jgi:SET domain-containing protein
VKTKAKQPALDPRHCCFRLRLAPSKIHRWGVYAEENIPANRKVIEYTGERISRVETKKRAGKPLNYIFTVDSYWAKDGAVGGSGAEYINHSCEPNIRTMITKGRILYMSKRPIVKGEELTVDYHFEVDADRVPCSCGAAACRGTINDLD